MNHPHLVALSAALGALERDVPRLEAWASLVGGVLLGGGRLLACGNGGSAEQAEHLTAELVGRYQEERPAFAAFPLHADSAALTAIGNDYGLEQIFARQVQAHGRPGDVLVCLSTSGTSLNVVRAAKAASAADLTTLALTGRGPNLLSRCCDDAIMADAAATCTVQEVHLAAIHILCAAVDAEVGASRTLAALEAGR
jgi:D-sedoheptulose 7-phosphate isomerase